MSVNEKLLLQLMTKLDAKYNLYFNKEICSLTNVSIIKFPTLIRKPTTRGGVYFSDTIAYKIKAITDQVSLLPVLSKAMLGPNQEFQEIPIETHIEIDGKIKPLILITNLINIVQSSSKLELNLIITQTNLKK